MTPKKMIEVIKAHDTGKPIDRQLKGDLSWHPCNKPTFDFERYNFRIAKKSEWRPWKFEEIPLGAHIKAIVGNQEAIITSKSNGKASVFNIQYEPRVPFKCYTLSDCSPCGVRD